MIPDRLRSSLSTSAVAPTTTTCIRTSLREAGRHQLDVPELGLRVSVTRSRYPNRPDGVDQYAVTLSRPDLDRRPGEQEVGLVLASAFGDASTQAVERSAGAARIRMFRVPAGDPAPPVGQPASAPV